MFMGNLVGRIALVLCLGLGLILPAAQVSAKGGCEALRAACEAAGFSDSRGIGKGTKIIRDCMAPLLDGVAPPGHGNLALPEVSPQDLASCQQVKDKRGKLAGAELAAAPLGRAEGDLPMAPLPLPEGYKPGPNIILILADDFSMNLMPDDLDELAKSMPNLARMRREGMTFDRYFVTDSLCCPSRSTIFTGLLPHNTGVITNTPPDGGLQAFMAHGNDARTFATVLHKGYYATAMMGKYLNGYEPATSGVPQGWSEWGVAGQAYANFNYAMNHNGELVAPAPHMTDQLSRMGQGFIAATRDRPFFLELATFSPHAPYTPPQRYADAFPGVTYPRTEAFAARPDATAPSWLQSIPPLDKRFERRIDEIYRLRVQSVKGIDDMIGDIRATLDGLGLAEDTWVIFTSDNGYHLGEFSLRAGKMTPFDTDIKVPLVVVGPGVPKGSRNADIVMNTDLFPTFLELAGLKPPADIDGQSLVAALKGGAGPRRNMAVIEHKQAAFNPDDPDAAEPKAGDPPSYVALRFQDSLYVQYLDGSGEVGFYDMTTDPNQMRNIADRLSASRLKNLAKAAEANHSCRGNGACASAQALSP